MTISTILHWIGAVSILVYGMTSAIKPHWIAKRLEHVLNSGRGISEFRVAHGSVAVTALVALYSNHPLVFQALGWACISAAVVRVLSYLPDRPKVTTDYLAFLVIDITVGIFLLL